MPIKEKSTYKKHEYEYDSPDGDKWTIFYIENEGRKYIQIGREGQDAKEHAIWDVEMLHDISDQIRGLTQRKKPSPGGGQGLRKPKVTDHRGLTRSNAIDSEVQESMKNLDNDVPPMESFSPAKKDEWMGVRTGITPEMATASVGETPEDLKKLNEDPDIADRANSVRSPRPNITRGHAGGSGDGQFKRVGAADIL